jgi:YebC/PmpR family DNA-binding regulatory protein
MSGHSKWASIKHQKGAADAKRGQLFTKLTREIIISVRDGGPSADSNFRLRLAIQKGRDANMPLDNIERAIKRGSGDTEGATLVELSLEGYGPGGAAIMVQTLSDNRNRSLQEVRNVFSRNGSNLGEAGCVAWIFEKRGTIEVSTEGRDAEELELTAIDAGADDVGAGPGCVWIYTAPENLEDVRRKLEEQEIPVASAEISLEPSNLVTLNEKTGMQTLRLIDKLEELDDVQNVYSNADIPDEIVEQYHNG